MRAALTLVALLVGIRDRFRFSNLSVVLITVFLVFHAVGSHYTYSAVPAGFWVRDALDLSRNHYDRLGHLAQGFIPAILAREVLLRTSPLRPGRWLFVLVTSVCMTAMSYKSYFCANTSQYSKVSGALVYFCFGTKPVSSSIGKYT